MNKQKILVAAEIFSANLGDYAIYDSMKSILLSKGVHVTPLDISGRNGWVNESLSNNKKSKYSSILGFIKLKVLSNRTINRIYSRILWEALLKKKVLDRWEKLVSENQLVVIGGGQLITDSNANFFSKIQELILICKKLNKPYVFMGCGASEQMSKKVILKYSKLINQSGFVSFRDHQSFNLFKPYLSDLGKSYVFPDFAFAFNGLYSELKNDKILGINIISLNNFKLFNSNLFDLSDEDYFNFWLRICQGAMKSGYKIKVITNGHVEDYKYANMIAEYLNKNHVDAFLESRPKIPEELYNQINSVDYIIATRMHAGIIAKALGKKSVTLIWDSKIPNVWKTIGMEESTIDYHIFNSEKPWGIIWERLNSSDQEKFRKDSIVTSIEMSLDIILDIIH